MKKSRTVDLDAEIKKWKGNFLRWQNFVLWENEIPDIEDCAAWEFATRDSDLLGQSNAAFITKTFKNHITERSEYGDVYEWSCSHWACGSVSGLLIRVVDKEGKPTQSFIKMLAILADLADYPVLDEQDWSNREEEATCENVRDQVSYILRKNDLSDEGVDGISWKVQELLDWRELEARDGFGGYPSEESVEKALKELGYAIKIKETA